MELNPAFSPILIDDSLNFTKDGNSTKEWNQSYNCSVQDNRTRLEEMEATSSGKCSSEEKSSRGNKIIKRKILPSTDLLGDCEIDPTLKLISADAAAAAAASSPENKEDASLSDSLTTPDFIDSDEVFDDEYDSDISDTPTSSQQNFMCAKRELLRDREEEEERWRIVHISDKEHRIDLKVIEPYKRVISHGGYYGDGFNTIIVLTVCYLPDNRRHDYQYVMRNLFLYVVSTLELLVMDEYTVVYFHGAAPRQKVPSFRWLRQIYEMIDRKFKKNLNRLLVVHPTFFLRTVMLMTKPFLSPKFYTKLKYVRSLEELSQMLPMEHIYIPQEIRIFDAQRSDKNSQ